MKNKSRLVLSFVFFWVMIFVLTAGCTPTAHARRDLASYSTCYDRNTEPYTLVVDAHNHLKRPQAGDQRGNR